MTQPYKERYIEMIMQEQEEEDKEEQLEEEVKELRKQILKEAEGYTNDLKDLCRKWSYHPGFTETSFCRIYDEFEVYINSLEVEHWKELMNKNLKK